MVAHGLPATVRGVALLPPWEGHCLLVVEVDIDENLLPRSHAERGFDLHLSLAFESDLHDELLSAALRLHERWVGRQVTLRVAWMGSGGAAMLHRSDPLACDPDIQRIHAAGWYAARDLHISLCKETVRHSPRS